MLPTLIIVFREVLEASLVVGIVMAATKGVARRNSWVSYGIGAGVAGAAIVAVFAQTIAAAAAGMGQELFNASVLFAAVTMLGWHNVWMGRHGREIAQHMGAVGKSVLAGERPLYALALVVSIAVLREGSEVVLFLYGIALSGGIKAVGMLAGGALGLIGGVAVGAALYFGLLRIPIKHLFTVTSWMILLLAAGMASQGADFLVRAGLLPALGQRIWDTSALLSEYSIPGQVLHTLVGYVAQPSGIQLVFYAATLVTVGALMKIHGAAPRPKKTASMKIASCVAVAMATAGPSFTAFSGVAKANLGIADPIVMKGHVQSELGLKEFAYDFPVVTRASDRGADLLERVP